MSRILYHEDCCHQTQCQGHYVMKTAVNKTVIVKTNVKDCHEDCCHQDQYPKRCLVKSAVVKTNIKDIVLYNCCHGVCIMKIAVIKSNVMDTVL